MVFLRKSDFEKIKSFAIDFYPGECCGLLIGTKQNNSYQITRVENNRNLMLGVDDGRFEIDPQERIHIERELRDTKEKVIGHFHSHPNNTSLPSKTDIEMAFEPQLLWLIVSIVDGNFRNFGIYKLYKSTKSYSEITYKIVNEQN